MKYLKGEEKEKLKTKNKSKVIITVSKFNIRHKPTTYSRPISFITSSRTSH